MRKLQILLLILMIPAAGFCTNKQKNKNMPVSRWREEKRMKPDSSVAPFTDTLFISFQRRDSFSYHNGNGFMYIGGYSISEDSILDFGTVRYKIVSRRPDQLVLANEMGIYEMGKDLSDTARIIVIDSEKILPVTDIDQMIGHWTVYKRTTKETGIQIDNAKAVKALYVTGASSNGQLGYVFCGGDALNEPSWYIKGFSSDQTLDCGGAGNKTFKVIKCQKGELVLEEDDITYYLKQYK